MKFIISSCLLLLSFAVRADVVAAGADFSCATVKGAAWCWGYNVENQLGTGATAQWVIAPAPVVGLTSGVTGFGLGMNHACAMVKGGLKCWGLNKIGVLGTGDRVDRATPVDVKGLGPGSGVTQVSANHFNTCAVVKGGLKCWGTNAYCVTGQGGCIAGKTPGLETPTDVYELPAGSGVTKVDVGESHACAVVKGGVMCWGLGYTGTLGDNNPMPHIADIPHYVIGLGEGSGATDVAIGKHFSCAVVKGGTKCWGRSIYMGQQNRDPDQHALIPVDVDEMPAGSKVTSISSFDRFTCALQNNEVRCWGLGLFGQHGDGTKTDLATDKTPRTAIKITNPKHVDVGYFHACAWDDYGPKCWADNYWGQVGNGEEKTLVLSPMKVVGLPL